MAGELLMTITQDERERARLRSRRMFETDLASDMATSRDIGRKEGIKESALVIARNMMKRKRPIDEIIEDTGLTRDEVENLSN